MASSAGAGRAAERGSREMRMSFEEVAKKLSLWHSATFRPLLTHDDLEPILAAAGFVPAPAPPPPPAEQQQPAVEWREYVFLGCNQNAATPRWLGPRPRLPYPRVDGLHLKTYEAFLGAVEVYLGAYRVSSIFHVRLMPVTNPDRLFDKVFRPMRNFSPEEDGLIVYRDGTLDERTLEMCSNHTPISDVGYHVIPGISCRHLGHIRKLDGNCHEEGCSSARSPPASYNFFPVQLKDICPNIAG